MLSIFIVCMALTSSCKNYYQQLIIKNETEKTTSGSLSNGSLKNLSNYLKGKISISRKFILVI